MEKNMEELKVEKERYVVYMKQYTVNGVYNGPELFLTLYRKADRELEEAERQENSSLS